MNPPLFLRFLNLLMNDAIFLLDEAIQVGLSARSSRSPEVAGDQGHKGFCQIQCDPCWGNWEEICLSLLCRQPGFKQLLWFLITKSLQPFCRCLILPKALCLQAALWQPNSCPWCMMMVSLCLSELPVDARKGFFEGLFPALELMVGRPADEMGDVDVAHPVVNVPGLSMV